MEDTLLDEHRTVSKSRMPSDESRRLDKKSANEDEEIENGLFRTTGGEKRGTKRGRENEEVQEFDHEVYDDRMFYAMLLKVSALSLNSEISFCIFSSLFLCLVI